MGVSSELRFYAPQSSTEPDRGPYEDHSPLNRVLDGGFIWGKLEFGYRDEGLQPYEAPVCLQSQSHTLPRRPGTQESKQFPCNFSG